MEGTNTIGYMLDCPVSWHWWYTNVQDPILVQTGYRLCNGILSVNGVDAEISMTTLGEYDGVLGPITREIEKYFILSTRGRSPPHLVMDSPSMEQDMMIDEPEAMATLRPGTTVADARVVTRTASHVHFNLNCRFTSQGMAAIYTKRRAMGGTHMPTVLLPKKYEKAYMVWQNSTLGIFSFWLCSPKQQIGRSMATKLGVLSMPVMDFRLLDDSQLDGFNEVFDKFSTKKFDRIMEINNDQMRHKMDNEILSLLGIMINLDDLRERMSSEPSLSWHEDNSEELPNAEMD